MSEKIEIIKAKKESREQAEWMGKWGLPWIKRNKEINDRTLARHLGVEEKEMTVIREKYRKAGIKGGIIDVYA